MERDSHNEMVERRYRRSTRLQAPQFWHSPIRCRPVVIVDIALPVALDPHGVPSARENWRIAELVLRDVEFVGIETFVIMQQVPRQGAIFVADAEKATKRHHCIGDLSADFI